MNQRIANRYDILEELGSGGMGTVYQGVDIQTEEKIAIKLLKPEIIQFNPDLVERFDREGEALRVLNHPHIVKVLDTVKEDDRHYIIMEYVGGGSLQDLLNKEEQLSVERTLQIALDLADALTRAHRLKIVHRDIKPANVLLAEDGTPRLTDFGVAFIEDKTHLTVTGSLVGTYTYLSPEGCRAEELDERTDIWSFGVMIYQMLTGKNPFDREQLAATITAILQDPVPDIQQYRPDIPETLVHLINRMLVKDRDARIHSVRQVGLELESILRGEDTSELQIGALSPKLVIEPAASSRFATPTPDHTISPSAGSIQFMRDSSGDHHVILRDEFGREIEVQKRFKFLPFIMVITILLATIGLFAVLENIKDHRDERTFRPEETEVATTAPTETAVPTAITINPVPDGDYMILVAQIEHLGGDERDVTRFIYNDLEEVLEVNIPFSKIHISEYPAIITSEDDADTIADSFGATAVVWGNYDENAVNLDIQMGALAPFAYNEMEHHLMERTTHIQVSMTDERYESVAPQVLGVLAVMQNADGDGYGYMQTIAVLDAIDVTSATISGDSVAAHVHRYFTNLIDDTETAIEEIEAAIENDPTNPLVYALRSLARQRLGKWEDAEEDATTAARLGPENWLTPLYLRATIFNDAEAAIADFTQIIEARPDDWAAYSFRGTIYYHQGDYELAKADMEKAIEVGTDTNTPYLYAALIAIREAEIADVHTLVETTLKEYPDPTLMNRIMEATFGDEMGIIYSPIETSFGTLILGQYAKTIEYVEASLAEYPDTPELYFIKGMAHCRLQAYEEAEAAYTQALELDPTFGFVYMLRGSVRLSLDDTEGAADDFSLVEEYGPVDETEFKEFFEGFQSGEVTCDEIL